GTRGAQSIVDIDDLQDARQQRYVLARQAVGIAAAVPMLMVMADNRQHSAKRLERLADVLADHRMLFHDRALSGSEARILRENLIRNRDLAQVVQEAAAFERHDRLFIKAHVASKLAGIAGQPLAMSFGMRIARLHAQSQ